MSPKATEPIGSIPRPLYLQQAMQAFGKGGPFRYQIFASEYLKTAKKFIQIPVKQAVISASAISLLCPSEGIEGYPHEQFIANLINEAETDIRRCLNEGAYNVQIDFTEARLALKLDPSKGLLSSFIDLDNQVLARFTAEERSRIGVYTCPGIAKSKEYRLKS